MLSFIIGNIMERNLFIMLCKMCNRRVFMRQVVQVSPLYPIKGHRPCPPNTYSSHLSLVPQCRKLFWKCPIFFMLSLMQMLNSSVLIETIVFWVLINISEKGLFNEVELYVVISWIPLDGCNEQQLTLDSIWALLVYCINQMHFIKPFLIQVCVWVHISRLKMVNSIQI